MGGVGLRLTLEEVAAGAKKEIVYDRLAPCPDCDGTGLGPTVADHLPPIAAARAAWSPVQHTFLGDMQSATTMQEVRRHRPLGGEPVPRVRGQGRVPDRQRVTVEVPVGIRDAQQLRLSASARRVCTALRPGDLIVTRAAPRVLRATATTRARERVHRAGHPRAEIEIDGIFRGREGAGAHSPKAARTSRWVRVKGFGMPKFRSDARGDMFVHVNVVVPKKVTKKQRELLEQLAADMGEDVPDERTPLQKLRDAFQ